MPNAFNFAASPFDSLGPEERQLVRSSVDIAAEEVIAYALEKKAVGQLIARNATFGAMLFADLSNKLSAIAQRNSRHELPVRELANFSLISVKPSDQLGDALALMIRKRVHRVVVAEVENEGRVDPAHVVGVMEALDMFSFLSNHSYLISIQILR